MSTIKIKMALSFVTMVLSLSSCSTSMNMTIDSDQTVKLNNSSEVNVKYIPIDISTVSESVKESSLPESFFNDSIKEYVLGPFDVVLVAVWEHPELTQPLGQYRTDNATGQNIAPDGTIFFPYAGRIKAAGLTIEELRLLLISKLSKILESPQIDVKLVSSRSRKVFVGGEVVKQGILTIGEEYLTLPEAISLSGGLSQNADLRDVWLTRDNVKYHINYLDMFSSSKNLENLKLKNSDKLFIPSIDNQKVYLLGEIKNQKVLTMKRDGVLTLAQAITEGDIDKLDADAGSVYVIRSTDKNSISVYHLDITNPISIVLADRFNLKASDIVYVDNYGLVRWNRFLKQILPTAQLLNSGSSTAVNGIDIYNWKK